LKIEEVIMEKTLKKTLKPTPWQQAIGTPQTYALMVSTLLGFGGLVGVVGNHPLVWAGGSGISLMMLGSWVWGFRSPQQSTGSATVQNWLQSETLATYLAELEQGLPSPDDATWRSAKIWATQAQAAAQRIVEQDSLLHVDLLETLHTIIGLVAQIAEALTVQAQIQTPLYRKAAQQHLQASCDRLQDSNDQLQQLQDQLMLSKLERSAYGEDSALPQRLQTLIAANKLILETSQESHAS
jgi:hypothetical protein